MRAVTLNICLGAKFTPSFTWKLNPPAVAPGEGECRVPQGLSIYTAFILQCEVNNGFALTFPIAPEGNEG